MKTLLKGFFILIAFCLIATSCGKDDEPTKTELLCREWKVINIDGESLDEYYDEAMQQFFRFETDGNFAETFITVGLSVSLTGKWKWTDNEKTIELEFMLDGAKMTDKYKVQKLTDDDFWFTTPDIDEVSEVFFKCERK